MINNVLLDYRLYRVDYAHRDDDRSIISRDNLSHVVIDTHARTFT